MMESIALDIHVHQIPIDPERLAELPGVRWHSEAGQIEIDGHKVAFSSLFKPSALLDWLGANAIEQAWVSIPPPAYRQQLDAAMSRQWVDYLNDGLRALCAPHKGRLSPLIHLPVEHPQLCADIAMQAIGRGDKRFSMAAGTATTILSSAAYTPLWETLAGTRAFLLLHPAELMKDVRLDPFYLNNLIGNPCETGLAAAHLVYGRVLERFADMTICLAHGGGTTAMVAGRLQRGLVTQRPGIDQAMLEPVKVLCRLTVDCILHSPSAIELAEQCFGREHIVFGSDWPFPMGLPKPHEQLAGVAGETRRRILVDNPSKLARA
jgi:aminocarboxymuconate-semialdehyde decarboxylase